MQDLRVQNREVVTNRSVLRAVFSASRCARKLYWALTILAIALLYQTGSQRASAASADAEKRAGIVECTPTLLKKFNPGLAGKPDSLVCFEAYISNFDTGKRTGDNGRYEPPGIP